MKKHLFSLLCALCLAVCFAVSANAENIVSYAVTGGNIYFDTDSGAITGCDKSVTIANIPSQINGVGVTSIGSRAFNERISLTSLTIPSSVTSIGFMSFTLCTGLTEVTIPNSVTTIGDMAFRGCRGLEVVDIPDSVTSIGRELFEGCTRLRAINVDSANRSYKSINGVVFDYEQTTLVCYPEGKTGSYVISNNVIHIGAYAFSGCTGLTEVTIPNSVTSIGKSAFAGCKGLASVTIPNSVTIISPSAFYGCTGLTEVTIPSSVTTIGYNAFYGCTGLADVTIPSSVTTIGYNAFYGCTGLTDVTIPGSVMDIGYGTFSGCTGLTAINVDSTNRAYVSINGIILNYAQTELICYPGGRTGAYVIPNSVTTIGAYAFRGCTGLTDVTIPSSVTTIGFGAFYGCTGLTNVTIPNSVTTIGDWTFSSCASLTSVIIPNSVITIGETVFCDCRGMTTVTIPNSVTYIGYGAFDTCFKLRDVYYLGNREMWEKIEIGAENKPLLNATIHFIASSFDDDDPSNTKKHSILSFAPTNGALYVKYDTASFRITFDSPISNMEGREYTADADLTSDSAFSIYRASDDVLVYKPSQYAHSDFTLNAAKDTLTIKPTNINTVLTPGTEYYITMGEGFLRFADGGTNAAIRKGEWTFRTDGQGMDIDTVPEPLRIDKGEFMYISGLADGLRTYHYTYDESWFFNSSRTYQHELAKMSMKLSMAAFGARSIGHSAGDIERDENTGTTVSYESTESNSSSSATVVRLLKDLKFTDITVHYPDPEPDTIGYAIASKRIKTEDGAVATLIAAAVRGANYEKEWADNFNVGVASEHAGFSRAGSTVCQAIAEYVSGLNDNTRKIVWLTGFSRAAAVANTAATRLTSMAESGKIKNLSKNAIHAYCFECPRMVTTESPSYASVVYDNIFSIVNDIDPVPKLAPESWDFNRYGITLFVPSAETTSKFRPAYEKLIEAYGEILRYDTDVGVEKSQNRAEEYTQYLPGQSRILNKMLDSLKVINMTQSFFSNGLFDSDIQNLILKQYEEDKFSMKDDVIFPIIFRLLQFRYPVLSGVYDYTVVVAKDVLDIVKLAHEPELCLAWMEALDGKGGYCTSARTRNLIVNCPVDISVYDSSNSLVARIIDNDVKEVSGSLIAAYIDNNGQKIITLPEDEEYRIVVTATDEGTMSYQIEEYDVDTGRTERLTGYFDVPIKEGSIFSGKFENLQSASAAQYQLKDENDIVIQPSLDRIGDVDEFIVTALSEGGGSVEGGGSYVLGEYGQVTATADTGCYFWGWYQENTLISTDSTYRFRVDKTFNIVGRFSSSDSGISWQSSGSSSGSSGSSGGTRPSSQKTYAININGSEHGSVISSVTRAVSGSTVTLNPLPNPDYVLDNLSITGPADTSVSTSKAEDGMFTFTMPSSDVTVSAVFVPVFVPSLENPFIDVGDSPFTDAILWAYQNGITSGTTENTFSPNQRCTRAQTVTFLWRAAGSPAPAAIRNPFTDVSQNAYYYHAVLWAVEQGITNGTTASTFSPDNIVSRGQVVTFLYRWDNHDAAPTTSSEVRKNPFTDIRVGPGNYYYQPVLWAVERHITNGITPTTFAPDENCTRGQIVTFLYRFLTQ